jgi:hypothetical protein
VGSVYTIPPRKDAWDRPDLDLPAGTVDVAGRNVRLELPEDATAGEVLRLLARLRARGAVGFALE